MSDLAPQGFDLELVAEMLDQYAHALESGELDGAGRYLPEDAREQADVARSGTTNNSAHLRGHAIYWDGEFWRYHDTGEPTAEPRTLDRPCGLCARDLTEEGHDPCIAGLPGVDNACCGHGDRRTAYIQFRDGRIIRGFDVVELPEDPNE